MLRLVVGPSRWQSGRTRNERVKRLRPERPFGVAQGRPELVEGRAASAKAPATRILCRHATLSVAPDCRRHRRAHLFHYGRRSRASRPPGGRCSRLLRCVRRGCGVHRGSRRAQDETRESTECAWPAARRLPVDSGSVGERGGADRADGGAAGSRCLRRANAADLLGSRRIAQRRQRRSRRRRERVRRPKAWRAGRGRCADAVWDRVEYQGRHGRGARASRRGRQARMGRAGHPLPAVVPDVGSVCDA